MNAKWKKNYFFNSPLQEFQLTREKRARSERNEIEESELKYDF